VIHPCPLFIRLETRIVLAARRNSTEHNLDLDFNSLDVQREACEAEGC